MLAPLFALVLAAAAPGADHKPRVLVFDLKPSGGIEQGVVDNITGLCASILAEDERFDVLSGADLRQMLDLEGQKQAAGCGSDGSCAAELAGALNATYVLSGNVGYIGSTLNMNLALFDQKAGSARRASVQARDLDAVPTVLRGALRDLVDAPREEAPGNPLRIVAVAAGVGGLAAGAVLIAVSAFPSVAIANEETKLREGDAAAFDRARALQDDWYASGLAYGLAIGGGVLVVAGAAAIVAGIVMGSDE